MLRSKSALSRSGYLGGNCELGTEVTKLAVGLGSESDDGTVDIDSDRSVWRRLAWLLPGKA